MELAFDRGAVVNRGADDFQGLTLDGLKLLARGGTKAHLIFALTPYEGGWALRYGLQRTFGCPVVGWYIAERSRKIRRFATVEAAVVVAREIGLRELVIEVLAGAGS